MKHNTILLYPNKPFSWMLRIFLVIIFSSTSSLAFSQIKIYWADRDEGRIYRADGDGNNAEVFIDSGPSVSLALDTSRRIVYWTDIDQGTIKTSNLDALPGASGNVILNGLLTPNGIGLDLRNKWIYWTESGTDGTNVFRQGLHRAPLDEPSGQGNPVYVRGIFTNTTLGLMRYIAVDADNNRVYWTEEDADIFGLDTRIRRIQPDGGNAEDLIADNDLDEPKGIAIDVANNTMYWTDQFGGASGAGKIFESDLDGGNRREFISNLSQPEGIALDLIRRKIYWIERGTNETDGTIKSANLDGSDRKITTILSGLRAPRGIALDLNPMPLVSLISSNVGSDNVNPGSTNYILYQLLVDVRCAASTLNSVNFQMDGTYQPSDIEGFTLWGSPINDTTNAKQLSSTSTISSGNILTFNFEEEILAYDSLYLWITADIATNASPGTIQIRQPESGNFSFSQGALNTELSEGIVHRINNQGAGIQLEISPSSLNDFQSTTNQPSLTRAYTIRGNNLVDSVLIVPDCPFFELRLGQDGEFEESLKLAKSLVEDQNVQIYVRLKAGNPQALSSSCLINHLNNGIGLGSVTLENQETEILMVTSGDTVCGFKEDLNILSNRGPSETWKQITGLSLANINQSIVEVDTAGVYTFVKIINGSIQEVLEVTFTDPLTRLDINTEVNGATITLEIDPAPDERLMLSNLGARQADIRFSNDSSQITISVGFTELGTYRFLWEVSRGECQAQDTLTITFQFLIPIPENLRAIALNSSDIFVQWENNTDLESGYYLERSALDISNFRVIDTLDMDSTSYIDRGLNLNTNYFYRVKAFNQLATSEASNIDQARPFILNENLPATPLGAVITPISQNRLDLAWEDRSNNELGFIIYRQRIEANSFKIIDTTEANQNFYIDEGLIPSTNYSYFIRAYNETGNSGSSNIVSTNTLIEETFIFTPSLLRASSVSSNRIDLTWLDNSNNEQGFIVERFQEGQSFLSGFFKVEANTPFISDTDLQPNTTYFYRIRAFAGSDTSAYSNWSGATTGSDVITAISYPEQAQDIKLYPNPNRGFCVLEIPQNFTSVSSNLSIFSAWGGLVQKLKIPASTERQELNLQALLPGIYYLELNTPDNHLQLKMIKY